MSNYTVTTNFGAKDSLPTGNAAKLIKGSEFTTEFDNIATAVATKADTASPTFTGTISAGDNVKIQMGNDDDLEIYHDASGGNSVIADVGAGALQLRGSAVRLLNADGTETLARFTADGASELLYDNANKLTTTTTGVTVTGVLSSDGLNVGDNDKLLIGTGNDLEVYHGGANSIIQNNTGHLKLLSDSIFIKNTADTEFIMKGTVDAGVELYYDNSKKLETVSDGLEVTGTCDITKASNGIISEYRQGSDTCASLRVTGGTYPDCTFGNAGVALRFLNNINDQAVAPYNVTNNNVADNFISLGTASARYEDIYATNGTIQTSDQNDKQDIAELSEAEQRVAVACKGLIRKFKWKSAVASKGSDARYHFGVIAQDVQAAFAAEGLDAGDYGLFISSTWTDEETGQERTRLGVRYSELLAFIIGGL